MDKQYVVNMICCIRVCEALRETDPHIKEEILFSYYGVSAKGHAELQKYFKDAKIVDLITEAALTDKGHVKMALNKISDYLHSDLAKEVREAVEEARSERVISDQGAYEMYHYQDPTWKETALKMLLGKDRLLIHKQIHKAYGSFEMHDPDLHAELFNSGFIGMQIAMKKYDPTKGSFTAYAMREINHQAWLTTCSKNGLTSHYTSMHNMIKKATSVLVEMGLSPTIENIAIMTDKSPITIKNAMQIDKIKNIKSIEADSGKTKDIEDIFSKSPTEIAEAKERQTAVIKAIKRLPKDIRMVIVYTFFDNMPVTDISEKMNISQEDVTMYKIKGILYLKGDSELAHTVGREILGSNAKAKYIFPEEQDRVEFDAEKELQNIMSLVNNGIDQFEDTPIYGDDGLDDLNV